MYDNFPLIPYGEDIRLFFLITLGYHTLKTVEQLIRDNRRSDYIEMMLHHFLTLVLYAGSYLINCVEIGILVVYCHDWADVFGHFGKSFGDTHFKYIKYFNGVSMWLGWLISRLITFPLAIWYGVYVVPYEKVPVWKGSNEALILDILGGFCGVLLLLNIWWFYLITKMVYRFAMTGKTEDI